MKLLLFSFLFCLTAGAGTFNGEFTITSHGLTVEKHYITIKEQEKGYFTFKFGPHMAYGLLHSTGNHMTLENESFNKCRANVFDRQNGTPPSLRGEWAGKQICHKKKIMSFKLVIK